jgi:hypothetical protein
MFTTWRCKISEKNIIWIKGSVAWDGFSNLSTGKVGREDAKSIESFSVRAPKGFKRTRRYSLLRASCHRCGTVSISEDYEVNLRRASCRRYDGVKLQYCEVNIPCRNFTSEMWCYQATGLWGKPNRSFTLELQDCQVNLPGASFQRCGAVKLQYCDVNLPGAS